MLIVEVSLSGQNRVGVYYKEPVGRHYGISTPFDKDPREKNRFQAYILLLTAVRTNIIADESTDHAEPLSICFLP